MVSKIIAFCAVIAAAQALVEPIAYSAAPALATVYNSFGAPQLHSAQLAAPALHAAPLARFSPANTVSHVYSSLAAPAALAYAPSYNTPAIGTTHQNVVRSFDGTVSHHSKAVDTAFSSVRKSDTRINNKVYSPALAYAAAPPAPALYQSYAAPALYASAGHVAAAPITHVTFDGYGTHYAY